MTTLSDVAATVADMLMRNLSDDGAFIKSQIAHSIRRLNRDVSHVTELRALTMATAPGTAWYSTVDATAGEGYGAAQGSTLSVRSILSVDYIQIGGAAPYELAQRDFRSFERLRQGSAATGEPAYWTLYGGRIGFFPTPNAIQTVEMAAQVKPAVPAGDSDTSVWFDEALELVEAMAAARVARKLLQDEERAMSFDRVALSERQALYGEAAAKVATGRLTPHD